MSASMSRATAPALAVASSTLAVATLTMAATPAVATLAMAATPAVATLAVTLLTAVALALGQALVLAVATTQAQALVLAVATTLAMAVTTPVVLATPALQPRSSLTCLAPRSTRPPMAMETTPTPAAALGLALVLGLAQTTLATLTLQALVPTLVQVITLVATTQELELAVAMGVTTPGTLSQGPLSSRATAALALAHLLALAATTAPTTTPQDKAGEA